MNFTKNQLIEESKSLYNDISFCIEQLISARISHDSMAEGKALFMMEGLMCGTEQHLTCVIDYLNEISDTDKTE